MRWPSSFGAACFLAGIARLGFLANLLSRPVLVGYMAGIAVVMIASQLEKLSGVPVQGEEFVEQIRTFAAGVGQAHWPTIALAAGVLAALLVMARWLPRAPGPLIAVLGATAIVALFSLDSNGIAVVGQIPSGLPSALGVCNAAAGVTQGFPVSSSGSRTALGDAVGSRTQLFSLIMLAAVVLVMLFGRGLLAMFPKAALGALIVYAALRLIDIEAFRRLARFRRSELILACSTTAAVLAFGVLYGVLVAVGLSILDLLRRVAHAHDSVLGFVLNAEANVEVDLTALDALDELRAELSRRGTVFAMARVKQDLRNSLQAAGLLERSATTTSS